jgi:RNA-directed DNA polymerase
MQDVADGLRSYVLRWKAYFRLAQMPRVWKELDQWMRQMPRVWKELDQWMRQRVRAIQLK